MRLKIQLGSVALQAALIFGFPNFAFAECPWVKWKPLEILAFNYDDTFISDLTAQQVKEDLECLRIVLKDSYSLQKMLPQNPIINRLDKAINQAQPFSSLQFLDQIFSLHQGLSDLHLGYQGGGNSKRFVTENPIRVSIDEDLDSEKIYDRPNYAYFRPGRLLPELTSGQKDFISFVGVHDKNLVLDLRGNRGGDNIFGQSLVESIFSKNQAIPRSKTTQIIGHLQHIGLCISTRIIYGDAVKEFCDRVKEAVKDLSFQQLLTTTLEEKINVYSGLRSTPYQAQIFILTDSECASACETIVEKLGVHPMAKVIGAHTAGALHFGNAMSLKLPHSGIWIKIPTLLETYERDAPEGRGYEPDVATTHIELGKIVRP